MPYRAVAKRTHNITARSLASAEIIYGVYIPVSFYLTYKACGYYLNRLLSSLMISSLLSLNSVSI